MKKVRFLTILVILVLVMSACAGPAEQPAAEEPAAEQPVAEEPAAEEPAAEEPAAKEMLSLAGVCPDPVVIQTSWFPEAEHGSLYNLIGDDYTIDTEKKVVRGSLVSQGEDMGVDVEVRTGGPAIGFQQPVQQMYVETDIMLAFVSTDEAVFGSDDTPILSVVAPLEKNPQIIMWDPGTYPDAKTVADLGAQNIPIQVFAGGSFIDVFVNEGILSSDQVDPTYDGSPARWITEEGAIAQQGFASAEPYNYEYVFEDWGQPVAYELIHDAGFEVYHGSLSIRKDELEELRPCLEQIVPIIQQSVVDYVASPDRANAIIIDAVETYEDFWTYSPELANYAYETMLELGLISNGSDNIVGNIDLDRVQGVIDKMVAAGLDVNPDLKASDFITNEFIDESIGLP